jgi:large subunit ribosomal protein L1
MAVKHGKRYRENLAGVPEHRVPLDEAVRLVKGFKSAKFDSTVELVMHLGVDPRQADQNIRGAISLPHGLGKSRAVVAFCEGDDVEAAREAGAVEAGSDDLIQKVQDGWTDFDVAIATPQMMKSVSRLGRVLGPQGKMPSPKAGTVREDVADAVREYAAGKVEYRNDAGGNVHVPVGKISFDEQTLRENAQAFIDHIKRLKPTTTKGAYIKNVCLSATMTPSVKVEVARVVQ